MNWQDFLTAFLTQINQNPLTINYQPTYQQANEGEVLLGLGDALDKQQAGICLNQKGTARHSVSEFVALADAELLTIWQHKIADKNVTALVYVLEDFSPDTCLGLILTITCSNGVDQLDIIYWSFNGLDKYLVNAL